MVREVKGEQKEAGKVRVILINIIRAILVLAFFYGFYHNGSLIMIVSVFAFFLTFIPTWIERIFDVKVPAKFEVLILLFVYGILAAADIRGVYSEFAVMGMLLNIFAGLAIGFVGFSILYVLHNEKKLNTSLFVIAVLTFCFSVAVGTMWEIFEFGLDSFFGFTLQKVGIIDTMGDLIANSAGALIVAVSGYFYIKNGRVNVVSGIVKRFMAKNPKLFDGEGVDESGVVLDMIKGGEGHKVEFKSSLRTNLHTKEIDKKVEHASLKTITAYLNSNGGTLLIGVGDKGEMVGLGNDSFSDRDKAGLHFTNLIKNHIGPEYLPYIKFNIVNVGGKEILKVDCEKSRKHVFLRQGDEEEFYVRNGPSSVKLNGNALVDYISNNFKGVR